jgi:hypothetical protein
MRQEARMMFVDVGSGWVVKQWWSWDEEFFSALFVSTYDEPEKECRQVLHSPQSSQKVRWQIKHSLSKMTVATFHDSTNKKGTGLRGSTSGEFLNRAIEHVVNISAGRQPGIPLFGHDKVERRMSKK